jgi:SAM-dependent methyltransferase
MTARVSARVRWAVGSLPLSPGDQVLEVGCGPGATIPLIGDQLTGGGRILAIDRSATAVRRALAAGSAQVAAGTAEVRQAELANLGDLPDRFDIIFAINVSVFWIGPARAELAVVERLLRPGGTLRLFYETPDATKTEPVARKGSTLLAAHGWTVDVLPGPAANQVAITARRS